MPLIPQIDVNLFHPPTAAVDVACLRLFVSRRILPERACSPLLRGFSVFLLFAFFLGPPWFIVGLSPRPPPRPGRVNRQFVPLLS